MNVTVNGKRTEASEGVKLSELIHADKHCGGHGKCGKCKVIANGSLSPITETEKQKLSPQEIESGVRLACMTIAMGDCEIETNIEKTEARIMTEGYLPKFELNPIFKNYGIAIDIGTTTIAARLYGNDGSLLSEESKLNPQIQFGADVISRIEASVKGKKAEISTVITEDLNKIITTLTEKSEISANEIDALVITGNTAMLHLLTETDVTPLSKAPFEAKRLFGETLSAKELGLSTLSTETAVYFPPCISAFVGADTVCAIIASEMMNGRGTHVLADIGTNGEIALSHKNKLTVCSTAAGPAFEGAGISMGMGGKTGAVDKVEVINGKMAAHVIGEIEPVGICGSGIVDAVKCLLETEELDENGYLENEVATVLSPVVLTQEDIRKVQLAKSAIYAGIKTALRSEEIELSDVSEFFIAGGFGSFLNVENAGKIGLIPQELTDKATVLGNAALGGASMILLNCDYMQKAWEISTISTVLNLASNPIFTEEYMEGMFFPL